MKSFLPAWWRLVLAASVLSAPVLAQTGAEKARAKRDAVLAQVVDVPGLPRVLLLGDSISMGYTLKVRELLAGKANVHRPAENCADSGNGVRKLDTWLGSGKWDVIHFNFGLHDLKYVDEKGGLAAVEQGRLVAAPETYERQLRELVARMQRSGATVICATTTPVPAKSNGRVEGSERVYNAAAVRVAKETGVLVNDLHAFVVRHPDPQQLPNNVHFTPRGYDQLAVEVAARIEATLARRR